ncbi:hypothetical protein ZWY2020_025377 [Hordeum vulgare]|nr:hypothetical protein ZWY2020_025377 [Hordeum vulgare]
MAPPPLNLAGSTRIHAKSAENGSTPVRSSRIRPGPAVEGKSSANGSAWPVANPVLTCASAIEAGYPSNFIANPLLYLQVRSVSSEIVLFCSVHVRACPEIRGVRVACP